MLPLRALQAFAMMSWGGSAFLSGRRIVFAKGAKAIEPRIGRARLATSCTERCDLTFEGGRLVFRKRGIILRGRSVQRPLCQSGARCLSREGKVRQSRPAAGLMVGAAQTSLKAVMRHL